MSRRSKAGRLGRWSLIGAIVAATAIWIAARILSHPETLFPHRVTSGRLALYSDETFPDQAGLETLAEIDARLTASGLDRGDGVHRIVVVQAIWRQRLAFLWNFGAGGVNYYPATRTVFLRRADIAAGALMTTRGELVPPPRTLAYFATHEILHSLTGEAIGAWAYWRLPVWMREGVADHLALRDAEGFDTLAKAFLADSPEMDPQRSGLYARYRLLVLYLVERRAWSLDRLLRSDLPQVEAERMLRTDLEKQAAGE